jgi:hypothetical protein
MFWAVYFRLVIAQLVRVQEAHMLLVAELTKLDQQLMIVVM